MEEANNSSSMSVRSEFKFLLESEVPNITVVTARGIGKTVASLQLAIKRALTLPNDDVCCIFYSSTLKQVKLVVEPKMRILLSNFPNSFYKYNSTIGKYSFFVGRNDIREIILSSYEKPDNSRGFHPHTVIMDECSLMPAGMYGEVIAPMFANHGGSHKLIAIGTPKGKNKFYEFFRRGTDSDFPDWESYAIKASETKLLDPYYLIDMRNNLSTAEYAQEFECDFDANVLVGSVYGEFMQRYTDNNVREEYIWDPSLPVWTAWDLGYSDYTAIWFFQVKGNQVTFIDFFEDNGKDTSHYANILNRKPYNYAKCILPHDGGRSDMRGLPISEQLRGFDFKVEVLANTSELGGIDEARRLLKTCRFSRNDECLVGLEHLKSFKWKMDKRTGRKMDTTRHDEHSHCADAFRYAAVSKDVWENYGSGVRMIAAKRDYNVLY